MVQPANPIRVSELDQPQRTPKLALLRRSSSPNGHQHRERHGVVGAGALVTITDANSSGLQGCETRYLGISSHCALSLSLGQEGVGQADLLRKGGAVEP